MLNISSKLDSLSNTILISSVCKFEDLWASVQLLCQLLGLLTITVSIVGIIRFFNVIVMPERRFMFVRKIFMPTTSDILKFFGHERLLSEISKAHFTSCICVKMT